MLVKSKMARDLFSRFWSKVNKHGPTPSHCPDIGPCWTWTRARNACGYGLFKLSGKAQLAHRVSWFLEHGSWPQQLVLHRCDNPACVRPEHLFPGDPADNSADKIKKGRLNPRDGERNGRAKLSRDDVASIRSRHAAGGVTQTALAKEFGVSQVQISHVVRGIAWTTTQSATSSAGAS